MEISAIKSSERVLSVRGKREDWDQEEEVILLVKKEMRARRRRKQEK